MPTGLMGRVFANGSGSNPSTSHTKDLKRKKKVLEASLLNTQHYKVHNKGVDIAKEAFWSPSTSVANFIYITHTDIYLYIKNKYAHT